MRSTSVNLNSEGIIIKREFGGRTAITSFRKIRAIYLVTWKMGHSVTQLYLTLTFLRSFYVMLYNFFITPFSRCAIEMTLLRIEVHRGPAQTWITFRHLCNPDKSAVKWPYCITKLGHTCVSKRNLQLQSCHKFYEP